jgi:hypothetical protein
MRRLGLVPVLALLVAACGDGGGVAVTPSATAPSTAGPATTTAVSTTISPLSSTTMSSATPPNPAPARIVGTLRDGGNGLPIGGMFEQGTGIIGVAAIRPDGRVIGWADNRCDGSFEVSVPPGRYALLAGADVFNASYWVPVWALSETPSDITGERLRGAFSDQETVTPLTVEEMAGAEWFDVAADQVLTVDATLPLGPETPPPGAWFEAPPPPPQLAVNDPRRDPDFWLGKSMSFAPTQPDPRPTEQIFLEGQATGLWAVIQPRAPDDPNLPRVAFAHPVRGHDICWDPGSGYGFLFVVGASGRVIDATEVDLGESGFVCWHHGEPQPLPDPRPTAVLGYREHACGPPLGTVTEAWVLEPTGLVEIDPGGAYYLYPYN